MPARTETTHRKNIVIPADTFNHYHQQAETEAQSVSSVLRGVLMRDYRQRLNGTAITAMPNLPEVEFKGAHKHQVSIPNDVFDFYQEVANDGGVEVAAVLRAVIMNEYLRETEQ
jgi:hypothetical protein